MMLCSCQCDGSQLICDKRAMISTSDGGSGITALNASQSGSSGTGNSSGGRFRGVSVTKAILYVISCVV